MTGEFLLEHFKGGIIKDRTISLLVVDGSIITQSVIENWFTGSEIKDFNVQGNLVQFKFKILPTGQNRSALEVNLVSASILDERTAFPSILSTANFLTSYFSFQEDVNSFFQYFRFVNSLNFYFVNQIQVQNFVNAFQNTANNKTIIFNKLEQLSLNIGAQFRANNCRYFVANKATLAENYQNLVLSGDTFITRGEYENVPSGVNQQLDYIRNNFNTVLYNNEVEPKKPTLLNTTKIGGTYAVVDVDLPTHANDYLGYFVFVNGFFRGFTENTQDFIAFGLNPSSVSKVKFISVDEYFNISPFSKQIQITTPALPTLFENIKAFYKLNETQGRTAIDYISGRNGNINGNPTLTGDGYVFSDTSNPIDEVVVPDTNGDLSPIGNSPFSVYFEAIFTENNQSRILGKIRDFSVTNNAEWTISDFDGQTSNLNLHFFLFNGTWDSSNRVLYNFTIPPRNELVKILITWNGDVTDANGCQCYFNGVSQNINSVNTMPSSFVVPNTGLPLYIGKNEVQNTSNRRFDGTLKNVVIQKRYITPSEVDDFYDEVENY